VSHYKRVFIKDCLGFDLYFLDTNEHSVTDCVVLSSAARSVVVTGRANTDKVCTLRLENVLVRRLVGTNELRVAKGAVLEAHRLTLAGLNFQATGGTVTLTDSIIAGTPQPEITIWKDVRWQADRNLYNPHWLRMDRTFYSAKTFADYQRSSRTDAGSCWTKVVFKEPFNGQIASPKPTRAVGVDVTRLPSLPK
jgi:hypothetical protein